MTDDPFDYVLYYQNSELQEDNKKLQTATAQLHAELAKAHEELTLIYTAINNTKIDGAIPQLPSDKISASTASPADVHDLLLSSVNIQSKIETQEQLAQNEFQSSLLMADHNLKGTGNHVLQAKLAKELIKLANSYKILELTIDIQASKRRFNFFHMVHQDADHFINVSTNCICNTS